MSERMDRSLLPSPLPSPPLPFLLLLFLISLCFVAEVGPVQHDGIPRPSPPHHSGQPEVLIDSGRVQGLSYTLPHLGVSGDAFLGIPFAQPPVDRLRFQLPVPVKPWPREEVLNATQMPNSCYQLNDTLFGSDFYGSNMWNPNTAVDEDCLYLNVWVPRGGGGGGERDHTGGVGMDERKRAVMIWIFGGGFYSGTTTLEVYDGRILASLHNVIVVSIGYRVGALGFLCLDHPTAPCNVGLFDQRLGLEWVKRNIRAFGGDPDNVTLFGESAGSVSVSLHLLSPLSWDFFHRAIMQSGTANMPWATVTKAEGKRRSVELAVDYMRCNQTDDVGQLADCLRREPAQRIVEDQWVSRGILQFPFLPVVDNNFLKESPSVLLRLGRFKKCPVLMGSNLNEGSWFIIYELYPRLSLTDKDMFRADFVEGIDKLFYTFPQYPQKLNSSFAMDAIKFQYTDWLNPDDVDANLRGLDEAVADFQFLCPVNEFALGYASAGQTVYMYYFTQRYSSNPWPDWMGVLHGDDVLFTFGQPLKPGKNFAADERELSRTIMNYWTNFAQTGDPNSRRKGGGGGGGGGRQSASTPLQWPIYTPGGKHYLQLNARYLDRTQQGNAVGRGPRTNYCAFWSEYLPQVISTTAEISEKERNWKLEFDEWSTHYIVNWKTEFDEFLRQRRDRCSGGGGGEGDDRR